MRSPKKLSGDFVWCVAYIIPAHIDLVEYDSSKDERYNFVEAYIPTIKLLKKRYKGKPQFEYVPLLFNYGFFRIPLEYAVDPDFLVKMRTDYTCIYAWLRNASQAIHEGVVRVDGQSGYRVSNIGVAIATEDEIAGMVKREGQLSVHSSDDISTLQEGMVVTLKGYPFEGLDAEVTSIDVKKKKVNVKLVSSGLLSEVEVDFDNVFYTVYSGYSDRLSGHQSLDELLDSNNSSKFKLNLT